ncbi:DNA primase family protein [Formosa sp. 4Alg 33]|uniref:DNA primase family protein n=1 Tax=Formosa sp. 4Alg 33 TaxID=3382189 RepID=UPI003D9C55C3
MREHYNNLDKIEQQYKTCNQQLQKEGELEIGIEEILNETETLLNKTASDLQVLKNNQADNILKEIHEGIEPVAFSVYCEENKLRKKHFLVACVEILLELVNKDDYSLCRKNKFIYLYNSEYWEVISVVDFKDFLGDVALKMGVDKFDAKHHLFKEDLYKQFLSDARLKEVESNGSTTLVNLNNGTFEITPTKQILREFRKSDFLTHQLPFDFKSEANAPQFQMFLNEVLPEQELQDILAEYLGYIFVKNNVLKLEKVLLLYGAGANGKSVLFEIMMALLGSQNVTNFSLNRLTDDQGNSRAQLGGKLLNYSSEINGKLESSIFKQLVSGEPVEARFLYKDIQIMTDYARLMFNCNELPGKAENTNAYFRRLLILPFRVTIPPERQDKDLSKRIIKTELSGVFNWVLNGLTRLLKNKDFTQSKIVEEEVLQYKKESDSVLMFLEEEGYSISFDKTSPLKSVYIEYVDYCKMNHYTVFSNQNFSKRLKAMGYKLGNRKSYGFPLFITKNISN